MLQFLELEEVLAIPKALQEGLMTLRLIFIIGEVKRTFIIGDTRRSSSNPDSHSMLTFLRLEEVLGSLVPRVSVF